MKTLSGGQAAVESLRAEKVEHLFGLIGSATMEMFDALYDASEINFIGVHDERTGTHMADGYARASGRQASFWQGKMALVPPTSSPAWRRRRRLFPGYLHCRCTLLRACVPRCLSGG